MARRGRTPSLITSDSGKPKFVIAQRIRQCRRCETDIYKETKCVEVPIPGSMGHRTYCCDCLSKMISKSREDLDQLEQRLEA